MQQSRRQFERSFGFIGRICKVDTRASGDKLTQVCTLEMVRCRVSLNRCAEFPMDWAVSQFNRVLHRADRPEERAYFGSSSRSPCQRASRGIRATCQDPLLSPLR